MSGPHPDPHDGAADGHTHHGHDQAPGHHDHDHDGHDHDHAAGWWGRLTHVVRPHSHDAADSVDSALESSRDGIRAVKLSLLLLALTAAAQAAIVVVTGSVALLADTIHNFSDALTALPLWVAFVLGRRPPNRRYTYGFGRAEDLAGVFIVLMIAASAVLAGYESLRRLADPQPLTDPLVVVGAGVIGFLGNELVAEYRIRVGRRIGSAALVADGVHARTDGFTSLAVVLGAVGALAGFDLADPLVGLGITLAILLVLRTTVRDIYRRLMDAVDPDLVSVAETTVAAVPGVLDVEPVRLRWIGHRLRAEVSIIVAADLGLVAAHDLAHTAEHELLHAVPKLDDALVHVSPRDETGRDFHAITAHHR